MRAVIVVEVFERTCWKIILLSADGKMCSMGSLIVLGIEMEMGKGKGLYGGKVGILLLVLRQGS